MSEANPTLIYYMGGNVLSGPHVSHIRYPGAARIHRAMEFYVTEGRTLEILEYGNHLDDYDILDARIIYWGKQMATLESD